MALHSTCEHSQNSTRRDAPTLRLPGCPACLRLNAGQVHPDLQYFCAARCALLSPTSGTSQGRHSAILCTSSSSFLAISVSSSSWKSRASSTSSSVALLFSCKGDRQRGWHADTECSNVVLQLALSNIFHLSTVRICRSSEGVISSTDQRWPGNSLPHAAEDPLLCVLIICPLFHTTE